MNFRSRVKIDILGVKVVAQADIGSTCRFATA